jgi:Tol biopolymer transport system component
MSLSSGTRLGPYEILLPIGNGGMGEVFKARDTRLDRTVAIKVSAAQFSARFDREARAIAALNHANICTLYDVGPNYLVMELVEGESPKGPLPLETTLNYARQIADALEAAHEKGIVHRDLKPANIKIKPDGTVKVLDFGLAKVTETRAEVVDAELTTAHTTQAGAILGTAAYMSPEQARGEVVDKRTDIWAFGVVLYEMLTGKPLFEGKTLSDTVAAVLTKVPDWNQAPPRVRRLLQACLERDPKRRLRDIGDMRRLLEEAPAVKSRLPWIWQTAAGTLAVALLIFLWSPWRTAKVVDRPLVRLDVDLGPDVSLTSQRGSSLIISPDGLRVAFVSRERLYTRRLDEPGAIELAGTQGAYAPFFSPDGRWVAFFAQGKLEKISIAGGGVIALCDATDGRGGSWGEDGSIIASLNGSGVLSLIPAAGGTPVPVTELGPGEVAHRWPQILPGGKAVLFTSGIAADGSNARIEVLSLKDHHRRTLQRGGIFGRYLPASKSTGYLLYVNQGRLFVQPFDPDQLEVRGSAVPLLQGVAYSGFDGSAQIDFSRNGTLLYRSGGETNVRVVTAQWMDSAGKMRALLGKSGNYADPELSPDGQRMALNINDGVNADLHVYDWSRNSMKRLTFGGTRSFLASRWSPDGRFIVFSGSTGLFYTHSDGAGKPQPLTQSGNLQVPWSFTSDGKRLAFAESGPTSAFDLWTVPVESDAEGLRAGKPEVFLKTPFDERQPSFSPDGRWLAYTSNKSGTLQIYVRAFPDNGHEKQISNNGGIIPLWSHNNHEMFFHTLDNQIMVAGYRINGDAFLPDKPRVWSDKRLADLKTFLKNFDLAPDGNRIVALMPADPPEEKKAENEVTVLFNFADEVRRTVAQIR